MKLKPPLLSRLVRTQPRTWTLVPIASWRQAAVTETQGASKELVGIFLLSLPLSDKAFTSED
jgi:hypothetical protein